MLSNPFSSPPRAPQALLRVGLPTALGGDGGPASALADAAAALWHTDPAAALLLRTQRLAIEVLRLCQNQGLAGYLLPQVLAGERALALPLGLAAVPLQGQDTGRGWRLHGLLPQVPNLQAEGFTLIAPVQLPSDTGGHETGWAALRGEEDGLDVLPPHLPGGVATEAGPDPLRQWARRAALGDVRCRGFFFREDEWLGGPELTGPLHALARVLAPPPPALMCPSAPLVFLASLNGRTLS